MKSAVYKLQSIINATIGHADKKLMDERKRNHKAQMLQLWRVAIKITLFFNGLASHEEAHKRCQCEINSMWK